MKQTLHAGFTATHTASTVTALRSLVNQQLRHSLSEIMRQSNSSVINELPADLYTVADMKRVGPIIQKLLEAVIGNAKKGRIRIRGDKFGDVITIEIQDQSSFNGYALEFGVRKMEPLARLLGGYITIRGHHELEMTVTFSFPDRETTQLYEC